MARGDHYVEYSGSFVVFREDKYSNRISEIGTNSTTPYGSRLSVRNTAKPA